MQANLLGPHCTHMLPKRACRLGIYYTQCTCMSCILHMYKSACTLMLWLRCDGGYWGMPQHNEQATIVFFGLQHAKIVWLQVQLATITKKSDRNLATISCWNLENNNYCESHIQLLKEVLERGPDSPWQAFIAMMPWGESLSDILSCSAWSLVNFYYCIRVIEIPFPLMPLAVA